MKVVTKVYAGEKGGTYEGPLVDGNRHGTGKFTFNTGVYAGNVYEGDWLNDVSHGQGVNKWASGDVYEGGLKDDNMHGQGVFRYADGAVYVYVRV